jgi:hypothetical protein
VVLRQVTHRPKSWSFGHFGYSVRSEILLANSLQTGQNIKLISSNYIGLFDCKSLVDNMDASENLKLV